MPIYEFACPKCRKIYSFLSKKIQPEHAPTCPGCGNKNLVKEMSRFATPRGATESGSGPENGGESGLPDLDDPKIKRAMAELERDMAHIDENNPKQIAQMMRKWKDFLPKDAMPGELDVAIRRLEDGEDPEKIEEDMGDVLDGFLGDEGGQGSMSGGYSRDEGLYDY